jgi:hypothetical protein
MPEPVKPLVDPAEIEKHNAEIQAKLEAQDQGGRSSLGTSDEFAEVGKTLDALAAEKTKEKQDAADAPPVVVVAASDDPDAAKKAEEAAAAAKAAEEAKAAAEARFKDAPQLPAGASPRSHEAFASIKIKATQDILERDKQIEELKKQIAANAEALKNPVPKELLAELEEARRFRAKLDVDVDPKFKEYDKQIDAARDFIYAQLKKSPTVTDATIEAIKAIGGPDKMNLELFFEKVQDPVMRRLVESKLADIEQRKYEKEQAQAVAKGDVDGYLKQREAEMKAGEKGHFEGTRKELAPMLDELDFLRELPKDDPKAAEHKVEIDKYVKDIQEALGDNSPKMRAVLITGTIQLFHERKVLATTIAENTALKASVKELEEKFKKIKDSSTTRLRESGAPPDGKMPQPKGETDFSERPGDAVDRLAKQIMAAKAAAGR